MNNLAGMTGKQPLLSACLIVRNEAAHLGRCLASLAGLADEINVVDTGSTDRTVEIARSFGARVVTSPWRQDFAFHRNESLARATGKWLLVIDADETVEDTDKAVTRAHLTEPGSPSLLMVRERLVFPSGHRLEMMAPRLLRAERGIRYVYPVHEHIDVVDEPAALSNVKLRHHGYGTEEEVTRKEERNLEIALSMGAHPHGLHSVARAAMALGKWRMAVDAAERLLNAADAPQMLRLEACSIGGACALSSGDLDGAERFAGRGRELDPTAPDVLLVAAQAAGLRYIEEARKHHLDAAGLFIRPTVFNHDLSRAGKALSMLRGQPAPTARREQACQV